MVEGCADDANLEDPSADVQASGELITGEVLPSQWCPVDAQDILKKHEFQRLKMIKMQKNWMIHGGRSLNVDKLRLGSEVQFQSWK